MAKIMEQKEIDSFFNTVIGEDEEDKIEKAVTEDGQKSKVYHGINTEKNKRFFFSYDSPVLKKEKVILTKDKTKYHKFQKKTSNDRYYTGKEKTVVLKLNI